MKDHDEQPTETASVPTYLSLCSGYDGIGLGLKRVIPDLRTIAHVEIEAFAIANLVTKMEEGQLDSAPVFTDLKRFPFEDLRERQPTILSAGFPCQPFSSAGKRQATDDPRHLWPFIADGITSCRPSYCFLENVEGIVSSKTADGESVLLYVLRDLEERGYTCTWGTFSAAEIGAPHLRKRVFILAKLGDADGGDKRSHGIEHRILSATPTEGEADRLERTSDVTELADGESIERQRTLTSGDRCERPEETVGSSGSNELADGVSTGLEGHAGDVNETTGQTRRRTHRPISESGLQRTVYPSRPGERQYEWEEPRVVGEYVGNASSIGSHRGSEDCTDVEPEVLGTRHEESYVYEADSSEAQSELGGTTDGFTGGVDAIVNRTDRLRLLGNGVVPDCAELAFRTLFNQLHNER